MKDSLTVWSGEAKFFISCRHIFFSLSITLSSHVKCIQFRMTHVKVYNHAIFQHRAVGLTSQNNDGTLLWLNVPIWQVDLSERKYKIKNHKYDNNSQHKYKIYHNLFTIFTKQFILSLVFLLTPSFSLISSICFHSFNMLSRFFHTQACFFLINCNKRFPYRCWHIIWIASHIDESISL